jgi:hypothetical protein
VARYEIVVKSVSRHWKFRHRPPTDYWKIEIAILETFDTLFLF